MFIRIPLTQAKELAQLRERLAGSVVNLALREADLEKDQVCLCSIAGSGVRVGWRGDGELRPWHYIYVYSQSRHYISVHVVPESYTHM